MRLEWSEPDDMSVRRCMNSNGYLIFKPEQRDKRRSYFRLMYHGVVWINSNSLAMVQRVAQSIEDSRCNNDALRKCVAVMRDVSGHICHSELCYAMRVGTGKCDCGFDGIRDRIKETLRIAKLEL